jgi:hypothetical protein
MNQIIKSSLLAVFFSFVAILSSAQKKSSSPQWISDKGYWVIESNQKQPKVHIVRFYNTNNVLVYKETLSGVKLNSQKRKVRMKLKKVLDESVAAWEKKKEPSEELAYVKAILN